MRQLLANRPAILKTGTFSNQLLLIDTAAERRDENL